MFACHGYFSYVQVILCYLIKMLFSYPLSNFPLRITIHYQLYGNAPPTWLQHTLETTIPLLVAGGVAVAVSDVSVLFSIVGAVARTSISFLMPAAMLIRAGGATRLVRAFAWFVFAFGAIVGVLGLAATIYFMV